MKKLIIFLALTLIALEITGYFSYSAFQSPPNKEDVPTSETAKFESISNAPSFEYPITKDLVVLQPYVRPEYISSKVWGKIVLKCKNQTAMKGKSLIGIRIEEATSSEDVDFECISPAD